MVKRKVFCNVLDAICWSDRCLFKLSKVVEDNPTCKECIVHILDELEETKSGGTKKGISGSRRKQKARTRRPRREDILTSKQTYSTQDLIRILEKSERRIREMAQEGKIPAKKVGPRWHFFKDEIDQWLLEKTNGAEISLQPDEQQESVRPGEEPELSAGVPGDSTSVADGSGLSLSRIPGELFCTPSEEGQNGGDKEI